MDNEILCFDAPKQLVCCGAAKPLTLLHVIGNWSKRMKRERNANTAPDFDLFLRRARQQRAQYMSRMLRRSAASIGGAAGRAVDVLLRRWQPGRRASAT
jgi:hypothetical protein